MALLTIGELEVLVREPVDPADAFALWNIDAASLIVSDTAGHPEWTIAGETAAPARARVIAQQLAKRAYLNPEAERSFNTGPIGAVTVEDYARTLELTPAELEYLLAIKAESVIDTSDGLIFVLSTHNRPVGVQRAVVLNDSAGSPIIYANEFDTAYGAL